MKCAAFYKMLQDLLQRYKLMDILSTMSSNSINRYVNDTQVMSPNQDLPEGLAFLVATTPRHWLRLRRVVQRLYPNILSSVSETIQEALFYTDELVHAQQQHSSFPKLIWDHLQYILARRMVLKAIQYQIYTFDSTLQWEDKVQDISDNPARERRHHRQICHAILRNSEVLLFTLCQFYAIAQERLNGSSRSPVTAGTMLNTLADVPPIDAL